MVGIFPNSIGDEGLPQLSEIVLKGESVGWENNLVALSVQVRPDPAVSPNPTGA